MTSLEEQLLEARQETKKVFNEFYEKSKVGITVIWVLSVFALGCVVAVLML